MKVCIIGVGLIGGSFALGLKKNEPQVKIYGIDARKDHLEKAKNLGVIDEAAELAEVGDANLVIIAVPVNAAPKVLEEVLDLVHEKSLVIDMGSTKQSICAAVENHPRRRNFLAAHPIAGTEFSGPEAAFHGLFEGKTTIICEVEKTAFQLQEKALEIFRNMGMRIRYMNPQAHDRHIAYVSHLSHISAFMLGKTVLEKEKNERDIFDLAGSGFASTVRLAKSSPAMWAPIFEQNKDNVLETLTEYIQNLTGFKSLLENENYPEIFREMEQTNHIKKVLNGII